MHEFFAPLLYTNSGKLSYIGHLVAQIQEGWNWILLHQMWIFIGTVVICSLILIYVKAKTRHQNIQKLWIFILFFLTKRQMLIPLVWTFAKRENLFDHNNLEELLQIRSDCRRASLKHKPTERLKLEQRVSSILYTYFSQLEQNEQIRPGSKFEKIVKDLEFMDSKLIELQSLYNLEAKKWNQDTGFFALHGLASALGMKHFDLFT